MQASNLQSFTSQFVLLEMYEARMMYYTCFNARSSFLYCRWHLVNYFTSILQSISLTIDKYHVNYYFASSVTCYLCCVALSRNLHTSQQPVVTNIYYPILQMTYFEFSFRRIFAQRSHNRAQLGHRNASIFVFIKKFKGSSYIVCIFFGDFGQSRCFVGHAWCNFLIQAETTTNCCAKFLSQWNYSNYSVSVTVLLKITMIVPC